MDTEFRSIDLPEIWELYGLRSNPFSTSPLLVKGGVIPLRSFYGRDKELSQINNILRVRGGSRVLVAGDVGVGKTSFVNYFRWSLSNKNYFTPVQEIGVQSEWTAEDFLKETLFAVYSAITRDEGLKGMKSETIKKLGTLFEYEKEIGSGGQVSALGVGGGITKKKDKTVQVLTLQHLTNLFQEVVSELTESRFKEVIIHYNNLELKKEENEDELKKLFGKLRDVLQTPKVNFIFIGDSGIPGLVQSIPRVNQVFSDTPIILHPFSTKETMDLIKKRWDSLVIEGYEMVPPCDFEAVETMHRLYAGNIRAILNSLTTVIACKVRDRPVTITKEIIIEELPKIAEERFLNKVNGRARDVLNALLSEKEATNKTLSEKTGQKQQNISKYLAELRNSGCIMLSRVEGREKYYSACDPLKWLNLKNANFTKK